MPQNVWFNHRVLGFVNSLMQISLPGQTESNIHPCSPSHFSEGQQQAAPEEARDLASLLWYMGKPRAMVLIVVIFSFQSSGTVCPCTTIVLHA